MRHFKLVSVCCFPVLRHTLTKPLVFFFMGIYFSVCYFGTSDYTCPGVLNCILCSCFKKLPESVRKDEVVESETFQTCFCMLLPYTSSHSDEAFGFLLQGHLFFGLLFKQVGLHVS